MNKPLKCFWWSHPCKEAVYNFGDLITPLLLNAYGLIEYTEADTGNGSATNLVIVGSVLNPYWNNHPLTIVGAGLLWDERKNFPMDGILALRGKLTKDRLGVTKDIPLGDPGLLVSRILPMPTASASSEKPIGIIPHWKDYDSPRLDAYRNNPRYKFINPRCDAPLAIQEICSCSAIIASSLHGLIVADSYGIPNVRLTFGNNQVDTNDFKYLDYYSAIDRKGTAIKCISPEDIATFHPADIDTSYQQNIASVQDKLHRTFLAFAESVQKKHGWQSGDFRDFNKTMNEAHEGNVQAMNALGDFYYYGKTIPKDTTRAYQWYKAAADRGYHWGMFNLGTFYYEVAAAKNAEESTKWFRLAADLGNFWAYEKLASWFNDITSMRYLADCYLNGYAELRNIGKEEGLQKGKAWLEKAAVAEQQSEKDLEATPLPRTEPLKQESANTSAESQSGLRRRYRIERNAFQPDN